jgi:uridine kinase
MNVPAAAAVLDLALARPATLGSGRLVCVDGPAGSGKSTLARAVVELAGDAQLVQTDDLLEGWSGLPGLAGTLEAFLRPLAAGEPSRWRRWDWHASAWAEHHTVSPGGLLVVEGVGSGARRIADLVTVLVWVEAPEALRLERGMARDGEAVRAYWEQWMLDEAAEHAEQLTRQRADLRVDAIGRLLP